MYVYEMSHNIQNSSLGACIVFASLLSFWFLHIFKYVQNITLNCQFPINFIVFQPVSAPCILIAPAAIRMPAQHISEEKI